MSTKRGYGSIVKKYHSLQPKRRKIQQAVRAYMGGSKPGRQIRTYAGSASWGARYSYKEPIVVHHCAGFQPQRQITTMRFGAEFDISTAGGVQDTVFRANSPYDPFAAAGGDQASGWDEMEAIYNYYRVHASGIKVTVVNLDTDDPIRVSVWASDTSTEFNGSEASAQAGCKTITVTPEHGSATVSHYARSKDILGPQVADSTTFALTSSNPSIGWFWHFECRNLSANALNLEYHCEISYRVEFFQLKTSRQT